MLASIIIGVLFFCYVAWVIRRKMKDIKEGRYCGCGCNDCQKSCSERKNN